VISTTNALTSHAVPTPTAPELNTALTTTAPCALLPLLAIRTIIHVKTPLVFVSTNHHAPTMLDALTTRPVMEPLDSVKSNLAQPTAIVDLCSVTPPTDNASLVTVPLTCALLVTHARLTPTVL
jgi:hypothetical protein